MEHFVCAVFNNLFHDSAEMLEKRGNYKTSLEHNQDRRESVYFSIGKVILSGNFVMEIHVNLCHFRTEGDILLCIGFVPLNDGLLCSLKRNYDIFLCYCQHSRSKQSLDAGSNSFPCRRRQRVDSCMKNGDKQSWAHVVFFYQCLDDERFKYRKTLKPDNVQVSCVCGRARVATVIRLDHTLFLPPQCIAGLQKICSAA